MLKSIQVNLSNLWPELWDWDNPKKTNKNKLWILVPYKEKWIKFLVHHVRVTTMCHPWGWIHHINTCSYIFNTHVHKLKYRAPKSGFPLKSQKLPMFDIVVEDLFNVQSRNIIVVFFKPITRISTLFVSLIFLVANQLVTHNIIIFIYIYKGLIYL